MTTYPTYPQPILQDPNGFRWYLEVSNAGVLAPKAMTIDAAWDRQRTTLINALRTASWRVSLDATPSMTLVSAPILEGVRTEVSVWSPDGREWGLRVGNDAVLTVTDLSVSRDEWPLVLAKDGTLYVLDSRFRIPVGGMGRRKR